MPTCKGCGAQIELILTPDARKKIPVNLQKVTIVKDDGTVHTGRVSHFATCTKADDFRKDSKVVDPVGQMTLDQPPEALTAAVIDWEDM